MSDSGRLLGADGSVATVERLVRPSPARPRLHLSRVDDGSFRRGQIVTAEVIDDVRDATRRNHENVKRVGQLSSVGVQDELGVDVEDGVHFFDYDVSDGFYAHVWRKAAEQ